MSKLLSSYEGIVGSAVIRQLRQLGEKLAGTRIVHVNSTREGRRGGGDPGMDGPADERPGAEAPGRSSTATRGFFEITKSIHNGLQGQRGRASGARTGRPTRT